jgi:hypothetical protein
MCLAQISCAREISNRLNRPEIATQEAAIRSEECFWCEGGFWRTSAWVYILVASHLRDSTDQVLMIRTADE